MSNLSDTVLANVMTAFNLSHFKHRLYASLLDGTSKTIARLLNLKLHEEACEPLYRCCCIRKFLTFETLPIPFGGVFPSDRLPPHQTEDVCYIFNSDPSTKPGEHWLAYYQLNGRAEFFDSFGRSATDYPAIGQWLLQGPFQPVQQLTIRLQGPSLLCGPYCLFFLAERALYPSMDALLNSPYHPFRVLSRGKDVGMTDEQLKCYLGLNDAYIFSYLADRVNRFVHMFNV